MDPTRSLTPAPLWLGMPESGCPSRMGSSPSFPALEQLGVDMQVLHPDLVPGSPLLVWGGGQNECEMGDAGGLQDAAWGDMFGG